MCIQIKAQTYFSEDFETGIPAQWTQEIVNGNISWRTAEGGYEDSFTEEKFPNSAKSGSKNALFQVEVHRGYKTKLITSAIDLSSAKKPELTFWHAQDEWGSTDFDKLRVYSKSHADSAWILLEEYLDVVTDWTKRSIFLPDTLLSNTFYIAFEGETNYGWGTCIDLIEVTEKGIIPLHVTDFSVAQSQSSFTTYNSESTPILQIGFDVFGNTGKLTVDSINAKFVGSDIDDVKDSGVKLFFTKKAYFSPQNQVGGSISFVNGDAIFSNLDYELPYGKSYLWLAYDIISETNHGNILDAELSQESVIVHLDTSDINFNENIFERNDSIIFIVENDTSSSPITQLLPENNINPVGQQYIKDEVFFDGFESDTSWEELLIDFDIDRPKGYGATENRGYPDPDTAYSGYQILGNDLINDGDYVNNYPDVYYAQTKLIDAYYYKDVRLGFQMWLNKETWDDFFLTMSIDSGVSWFTIKNYTGDISQNYWSFQDIDLTGFNTDRAKNVFLRVNTGPTDINNIASGWNIDNLVLAGDYIANDISVSELIYPGNGCGHTSADSVTIMIKNHGPTVSKDTIPLFYSFYGGDSIVYDTLFNANLAPEDSMMFTFEQEIDLSTPGAYDVVVGSDLPSDEYRNNDTVFASLFIQPTMTLPYAESFEEKQGLWVTIGNSNNTWEWGYPEDGAQDGLSAWATKLYGSYKNIDSSWIESVCINFEDTSAKVIDFYHKAYLEEGIDGSLLEYSLDNGQTWNYVDSHNLSFDWRWYNDTILTFGGEKGWSKNFSSWTRERQVLPDILDEESQVKFRIRFKSDTANTDRGLFIDNFKIYKAPYDIGVVSIDSITDACQNYNDQRLSFTIKNFGIRSLQAGDTIIFGVDATNNETVIDTLLLENDLHINDSVTLKANKEIDLSGSGNYEIKVYTLIEDEPFYYWPVSNDTASLSITIHPNPQTGLPDTIPTARPDTLILTPIYDEIFEYQWQPGNVTDSVYHVTTEGDYFLTVTNTGPTGCITTDTVNVKKLIPDVSVDSLVSPVSSCEFTSEVFVDVNLKNTGTDTLEINDTIYLIYEFNELEIVSDTFYLAERFYPDSVLTFSIDNGSVDMSSLETIYDFKIYTGYRWDTTQTNDTLSVSIESYGYPVVEIQNDLGIQMQDEETVYVLDKILNAGVGFETYSWSTGITTQRDTVTETGFYSVTITDEYGCPDQDTVYIEFDYLDVGVTSVVFPNSSCAPVDSFSVQIELTNTGTDTVFLGSNIDVGYKLNDGEQIEEVLVLDNDLLPDEALIYEFKQKEWFANPADSVELTLEAFTLVQSDINTANDSLTAINYFYEYPVFELGEDTLVKAESYTLSVNDVEHFSYSWNTGSDSSSTEISVTGEYELTVTTYKGCQASDSRRITIVQPDLQVLEIVNPVSECMPADSVGVAITVLNSGTDTLFVGDTIEAGYQLNEGNIYREDIILTTDLRPSMQFTHEFKQKVSFSDTGEKRFIAFVTIDNDLYRDNDNVYDTIEIYPYPIVELGNDTLIKVPSYTLVANNNPSYTYGWSNGDTDSAITVSSNGTYSVTVTSEHGCSTEDQIKLTFTFPNIGVVEMTEPTDLCGQDEKLIAVNIKNHGSDTLEIGEQFNVGYTINGEETNSEQIVLGQRLLPGEIINYSFNNEADMSDAGDYVFKIFTVLESDLLQTDDTLTRTLSILAMPVPKFMENAVNDTFKTTLPVTLDAGAGFIKYEWNDGQGLRVHNVSKDEPGWYSVTVTNVNGCDGSGSIYVVEEASECDTCCEGDTCGTYVDQIIDEQLSLDIYPNPASEALYIDFDAKEPGKVTMQLFNSQGKAVLNKQTDIIRQYKETINTVNLPNGIYILRVMYNNKVKSYRIVKQ